MTESTEIETKPDEAHFIKDIPALKKLEEAEQIVIQKQINDAVSLKIAEAQKTFAKTIEELNNKIIKLSDETDKTKKDALLDKVRQGKFDPEHFKHLSVKELESTVAALAKGTGQIVIPDGKKKVKDDLPTTTLYNPKTRKDEPI